jgi:selenocysteine-specific elongation factor
MSHPPRTLVIATAGHIDHGKTTLVRALTGIDTDRLPEEKRRGITIDLGFASMELKEPNGEQLRISFVDVPGHALFIRNMLAGAGCVPAVLLIVAADEGIKPQTVEHLAICELLGINEGIVALTKSDSVSKEQADQIAGNMRALAGETFLRAAPILRVSAKTGDGLAALRNELLKIALRVHAADSGTFLRLPIDRAFVIKGFGTVVTGTLLSGAIREGQSLVLEPGARNVRVRGLQTHGQAEQAAHAGTRVAVNLSGIDVSDVHRGQTLVAPETLSPVDVIDAEIRLLPSAPPLKHGARVHFHIFTSEVMARVSLYGYESVRPGSHRMARLKLDVPVVAAAGDRFVLRQSAPVATIGGGRVLDCHPEARRRKAATFAWLQRVSTGSIADQLLMRVVRRGAAGIRVRALAREAGIIVERTREYLEPARQAGDVVEVGGDLLVSRDALQEAKTEVMNRVDRAAQKAGIASIKSSELRSQTSLAPEVFEFVVDVLERDRKLRVQGEDILPGGITASPLADSERLAAIAQAYEAAGLAAPTVPDLVERFRLKEVEMRRLITLLQRQKTIVRMGSDDLFIHARALESLAARMAPLRGKLMDVAAFKQLTGLSRKYAIPLLEYLDHSRITRKQGDQRLVL